MRRFQRNGDRPLREPYYLQERETRPDESKQTEEMKKPAAESQPGYSRRFPQEFKGDEVLRPPQDADLRPDREPEAADEFEAETQFVRPHGTSPSAGRELLRATGFGELARAYVPVQVYTRIFPPEEALRRGSIFPELIRTPPLYQRLG